MCLTGDSGVGKTGALVSLILAGYKVRVLDVDNGVDIILNALKDTNSPYYKLTQDLDLAEAFRFETVNHKMITLDDGRRVRLQPAAATVWPKIENMVHDWKETSGPKLGPVSSWDENTIFVLDSGTFAGYAALYYMQQLNNKLGSEFSGFEWQRFVGGAQTHLETLFQLLYSDAIKCQVIVITHINYLSENYNEVNGIRTRTVGSSASAIFGSDRAYPSAIGRALGPKIGRYFNNVLEMRVEGSGSSTRRLIHTMPQGAVNVKTSAPFSLAKTYDVSTGLAEIFAILRNQPKPDFISKLSPNITKPVQQPSMFS